MALDGNLRSCGSLVSGNEALLKVKQEPSMSKEEQKSLILDELAKVKKVGPLSIPYAFGVTFLHVQY